MSDLSGQSALITGGGSGIGLACAKALAADGATVVLAARNTARLEAAAAELRDGGATVHVVGCDVLDEASVRAACDTAAEVGRYTMVVPNAGAGGGGPLQMTSIEHWNEVLGTNLTGTFLTIKHSIGHLAAAGGGSICAVSSIAAPLTHRWMTPYCVSKAGIEMLIRQTADELGYAGIRANAVRPSLVPTDITAFVTATEAVVDNYLDNIPVERLGTVDDVAAAVRFLLDPAAGWITGQCIGVDGGHTLRGGPNITPLMKMGYGDSLYLPGVTPPRT